MDSWSYISEGKGFTSDRVVSTSDSFSRSRNMLMGWEPKSHSSYGNNILLSRQQVGETQNIEELGFPEMIRKQLLHDGLISKDGGGRTANPSIATTNTFPGEDESSSRLSSSVVESNSRDSLLIDLKLGRFADNRDVQSYRSFKGTPNLSSAESSTPAKRIRSAGLNSQNAFCQVHGCNKDLSNCKDYHKRHKVCEIHSKTAKVTVNGIEQRFCQQCSRFHLLAEFDDGKRSCRKRLAGHNERRRKPQVGIHSGRAGRFLQSYNDHAGGRFRGNTITATSFICPEILPSGLLHPEKCGTNDLCRHVKVETVTDFSPPSALPITNGHLHSKLVFSPYGLDKQFPHFYDNGATTTARSILGENSSRYPHDPIGSNSVSRSLFQTNSLGHEDLTVFDTGSTIHGFSPISSTGCALSLLSSQSQNSSNYSSGIPITRPLNIPGSHARYGTSQVSERLFGVSPHSSIIGVSNKFPSAGMSSTAGSHLSPILISNGSRDVNFQVADGIFEETDFVNAKDHLSCDDGPTIDLLQLSTQLQRVERRRQSMEVKPENDAFCCLRITEHSAKVSDKLEDTDMKSFKSA